jgi:two-component system CheB/CheR fusion protein
MGRSKPTTTQGASDNETIRRLEAELREAREETHRVRAECDASIVELTRAHAHRDALVGELQHRVKNILATVSSLAVRMTRSSGSIEEFSSAFLGRLIAMGAMHEMLSARGWVGADLRKLMVTALVPYVQRGKENYVASGPAVLLRPNAAATLGMVFHELATNAAKYGALSIPDGKIDLSWQIEDDAGGKRLTINWAERHGPRVRPPKHDGFGSIFVERSVEFELEGTVGLEFEPSGVQCTISFPFRHNVDNVSAGGNADAN